MLKLFQDFQLSIQAIQASLFKIIVPVCVSMARDYCVLFLLLASTLSLPSFALIQWSPFIRHMMLTVSFLLQPSSSITERGERTQNINKYLIILVRAGDLQPEKMSFSLFQSVLCLFLRRKSDHLFCYNNPGDYSGNPFIN